MARRSFTHWCDPGTFSRFKTRDRARDFLEFETFRADYFARKKYGQASDLLSVAINILFLTVT